MATNKKTAPNPHLVKTAILALHAQIKAAREAKGLPTTRSPK